MHKEVTKRADDIYECKNEGDFKIENIAIIYMPFRKRQYFPRKKNAVERISHQNASSATFVL